MSAINGVFIIESLDFEDEEKGLFEGKVLKQMLDMLDVPVHYTYIRTKEELKVMIEKFEDSSFKNLHLSCHGNEEGIGMTLDEFSFSFAEFSDMFSDSSERKRLFLSSCRVMRGQNAIQELADTQFLSITGPRNKIDFNDAAIFWASFYHLMFSEDRYLMDNEYMKKTIRKLSNIFKVKMSTSILRKSREGYNKYDMVKRELQKVN